jgi:hypothetical protein
MKRICLEGAKDAHGADSRLRIGVFLVGSVRISSVPVAKRVLKGIGATHQRRYFLNTKLL